MERVISAFERGQTIESITRQNNHMEIAVPPGQSSQFVILHDVPDTARTSIATSIPSTETNVPDTTKTSTATPIPSMNINYVPGEVVFKTGPDWCCGLENSTPEPTGRTSIQYAEPPFNGKDYQTGWFAIKRDGVKIIEFTGPIDEDQVEQFNFEQLSYFFCSNCAMKRSN